MEKTKTLLFAALTALLLLPLSIFAADGDVTYRLVPKGSSFDEGYLMHAVRERNGGSVDNSLATLTLKSSDIKWDDNGRFYFKIVGSDGREFTPCHKTEDYGLLQEEGYGVFDVSGVKRFQSYDNIYDTPSERCFYVVKDDKMSFTFYLNAHNYAVNRGENGNTQSLGMGAYSVAVMANLSLLDNGMMTSVKFPSQGKQTDKFYLIGNFKGGDGNNWSADPNNRKALNKIEYPDSTVYTVTISQPAGGYGNQYFLIVPEYLYDVSDISSWNTRGWGEALRPEVHVNRDATALEGGLYRANDIQEVTGCIDNAQQSFNPDIDGKYKSYIFRMNLTTATYSIEYIENMYIKGDAIAGGSGKMKYDEENNRYSWTGTITGDGSFHFATGVDDTNEVTYWKEDDNVPGADGATDTDFFNHLSQPGETGNDVKSNLETGEYTVYFYPNGFSNDDTNPVYVVVETTEISPVPGTDNVEGTVTNMPEGLDYKYLRSYSNEFAQVLPEGVDCYVVSAFTPATSGSSDNGVGGTATLKKIDFIPANTGVILASKTVKDISPEPNSPLDKKYDGDNLLRPLVSASVLNASVFNADNEISERNYMFSYYDASGKKNYTLAFWRMKNASKIASHRAYLSLDRSVSDGSTTRTYYDLDATDAQGLQRHIAFVIGGNGNDGTTSISGVTPDAGTSGNDSYYTLQGVKVAKPTLKGIYIHNGKKIIIK